ncbi:threonine synthase [Calycomorphotria hydatis]|uniref:Threonine synthase n=1 Tax=Calycomorphotria hydatis TaxID=2528027 RepID=A0A517T581_9PLAN|nr:threonine synthase [Calycomorphotria hydatis]QDT63535.1 Threonine synthase [Calycomorphotria hydatis]
MTTDVAFQAALDPTDDITFDLGAVLPEVKGLGGLLDIEYDWDRIPVPSSLREFESRWSNRRHPLDYSGVWRFRELLPFAPEDQIVTIGEGQTVLQQNDFIAKYTGMNAGQVYLQYEGMNPSGSFKDNGMTAASTHARMVGAKYAACASTGNTSASLAIYASVARHFQTAVFVGSGKIALGKLAQALDYGAHTIQILGDFDDALKQVRAVCREANVYLCNSVNPFRLEGQKSIMFRVLESLGWEVPDWIVVPGGNLGNSSAFGKAFMELKHLGLIDKIPRLAVINAEGANTLHQLWQQGLRWNDGAPDEEMISKFFDEMDAEDRRAMTLATAIQINRPVNLYKCLRALDVCDGIVTEVPDQEILDAKAQVGAGGFGCEPASAASVAGVKQLRDRGVIAPSDRVVCILTGHALKDPDATVAYHAADTEFFDSKSKLGNVSKFPHANAPVQVENDFTKIMEMIDSL